MGSRFSWLDFSEHERRKALDVIDMFRERDARDELGVGTVRDALSDLLFPGISTIQTRARYFLFVPWIYRALERRRGAADDVERFARRDEVRLIAALAEADDHDGVIGIDARESLKRLPSNVYWQGLYAWGIKVSAISQAEYHRFFASFARQSNARREVPEDEGDLGTSRRMWHEALPEAPEGFPAVASFQLRKEESEYLRERLLVKQPGKLLSWLVDQTTTATDCAFPWAHPQSADFTDKNRIELDHARRFSLVMHGAALLYNLQLWELIGKQESITRFRSDLNEWAGQMVAERNDLSHWDRGMFWRLVRGENPRISQPTQGFVNAWLDLALGAANPALVVDREDARRLVADRERRLKGPQSRFENPRAREIWGGESAAYQLSYRWFQVQRIVNDIVRGLRNA